ncbi:MAG TPA: hypothetical protein VFB73_04770 [Chloroflexota bacterium]|nr:hypothetical protein [Chloroflexota bacterium]
MKSIARRGLAGGREQQQARGNGTERATAVFSPARARPRKTFRTAAGTPVAYGQPDGKTVRKFIRGSKHFLRQPPAIATDFAVLLEAQAAGFEVLEVVDTETGVVYTAAIERVLAEGIAISRGFGEQRALRLERWARRDPRQLGLFVAEG